MEPYRLCNAHLIALYQAIAAGDVKSTYEIEHELSKDEECVACAYMLKAHGTVRATLSHFLQDEGFMVSGLEDRSFFTELRFWLLRIVIVTLLFLSFLSRVGRATVLSLPDISAIEMSGINSMPDLHGWPI